MDSRLIAELLDCSTQIKPFSLAIVIVSVISFLCGKQKDLGGIPGLSVTDFGSLTRMDSLWLGCCRLGEFWSSPRQLPQLFWLEAGLSFSLWPHHCQPQLRSLLPMKSSLCNLASVSRQVSVLYGPRQHDLLPIWGNFSRNFHWKVEQVQLTEKNHPDCVSLDTFGGLFVIMCMCRQLSFVGTRQQNQLLLIWEISKVFLFADWWSRFSSSP